MTPKQEFYKLTAKKVLLGFEKRQIEGYYCENYSDAVKKALSLMDKDSSISWGGSETLKEIGLLEALKDGENSIHNYTLLDRDLAKSPKEVEDIYHKALSCDYYLMSSNAITLDGKLVNIDGNGNRIAALIYGPKNVIVIAGMNKIAPDLDAALTRVRSFASPINSIRLNKGTPCSSKGNCHNCLSPDSICCQILVTRMSRNPNRIKVILVGEELGY
ncbi:MAG: lactate utilization protein [Epulopiscium sp.]|nr:lactate utilization protein [Candidatus Epulonipiscium sp.]